MQHYGQTDSANCQQDQVGGIQFRVLIDPWVQIVPCRGQHSADRHADAQILVPKQRIFVIAPAAGEHQSQGHRRQGADRAEAQQHADGQAQLLRLAQQRYQLKEEYADEHADG